MRRLSGPATILLALIGYVLATRVDLTSTPGRLVAVAIGTPAACMLMFAPGFGVAALAYRTGMIQPLLALLIGSGLAWLICFFAWFTSPTLGATCSTLILVGSAAALAVRPLNFQAAHLRIPLAVMALLVVGFSAVAAMPGGLNDGPKAISHLYWATPDNLIPQLFADRLADGRSPRSPTLIGDWLSSDRPPLQTGAVLLVYPLARNQDLGYQLLGVALQAAWVLGLWATLRAVHADERRCFYVTVMTAGAGAIFLNTVFVWPKMLAGAMTLAGLAITLHPTGKGGIQAALFGATVALGILSHGGALFSIIPLTAFMARWNLRHLAAALAVACALCAPWVSYQKLYDPPGDRLLKWHLAGVTDIDPRSFGQVLVDQYHQAGITGAVANKLRNAKALAWAPSVWNHSPWTPGWDTTVAGRARTVQVTSALWAPGALIAAAPLLLIRRVRRALWFRPLALFTGASALVCVIGEFGSGSAHPFVPMVPYAMLLTWCALLALAALESADRLGRGGLFAIQWAVFVGLWTIAAAGQPVLPGGSPPDLAMVALAVGAGCGLAVLGQMLPTVDPTAISRESC